MPRGFVAHAFDLPVAQLSAVHGYACGPLSSALPPEIRPVARVMIGDKPIGQERFCVPAGQLADAGG